MSYNVLRQFVGTGGWGVLVLLTFGAWGVGVVQNRESPDFRSAEVGRYGQYTSWSQVQVNLTHDF